MSMTSSGLKSEVLNRPGRRRRRTPGEKLAIVAETQEPGVTVSLVARRTASAEPVIHLETAGLSRGVGGDGCGGAGGAGFGVPLATGASPRVAAAAGQEDDGSGDPQGGSRCLSRLKKTSVAVAVVGEGRFAMKTVCEVLNVARSNIAVRTKAPLAKPLGRPPQPEADLLDEIKAVIGEMPTYGYRRVWAVLRRAAKTQGLQPPNHKRVYRVMKAHGLLLQRHAGGAEERRHDGRIAVHRGSAHFSLLLL